MLRLLEHPVRVPHRCAFIPFIGGSHLGGFFDFGTELDGLHVYCSVAAAKQMAEAMGWAPQGPDQSKAELERVKTALAEMTAERDSLRAQLDAVHVLKNAGFTQARKPGRPRKAVA